MERYESLGPVGEGSYGTVLKCRHRDSGRLVAIKKFMDSDDDKTVKKIALREIRLLRQLRHDNLVNLLEVWKRRRRWYLVFEFVDRTLLDELEQNPNGLDLSASRQYLYQILRAAAFCHQQHIIHRDIKPENILISHGGVVKLCDFGFARTVASPSEGGVYTDYVATRWYRAPELLVGDIRYGKPVDVWAVGCLLIEMLTGQPLFPGDSDLDQLHHIVRCFGNLTTHHRELFYRNPVFSGVRLPECSGRVSLHQRFPTIPLTALDLAQSCLEMDPERRAQCSELLEHPLFTQDSFHIRFLDELNAKIEKDHSENTTLPKITKTPRQEKDDGDEKSRRGKDKKPPEDTEEKVSKEKPERTKGKQPPKLSKTIRNISEPLMSNKQSKTLGNKVTHVVNQSSMAIKSKPGKPTGAELRKESEKSTKTLTVDSSEPLKTAATLKDNNTVTAKPRLEKILSPEPKEHHPKSKKDCHGSDDTVASGKSMTEIWRSLKSEPSQEFGKNTKVPKLCKNSITDHPNSSSSPKACLEPAADRTDTCLAVQSSQALSSDHTGAATQTIMSITKPLKTCISEQQNNQSAADPEQRKTNECPKVLPSNPKSSKTTSTADTTKNNSSVLTSPLKTLTSDLSVHSSTTFTEASPANSTVTLPKGLSHPKLSKTGLNSKELLNERELTDDKDVMNNHGCLNLNPTTEVAARGGGYRETPESSESSILHHQSSSTSKITTISTSMPIEHTSVGTTILKTLRVSDKENREDLARAVLINPTFVSQVSKASGNSCYDKRNISDCESDVKFMKAPQPTLTGESKVKPGSFSDHVRSTVTPKTQKSTDKKNGNPERPDATNTSPITDLTLITSSTTVDHKASTRSSALHDMQPADPNELDFRVLHCSPPPPPPPPSSTPLLLLPSSTSFVPSFSVVSANSPATGEPFAPGTSFHPGTHSHRCTDKSRHHGGVYSRQAQQFLSGHAAGSTHFQASEKSLIRERSFHSDRCNHGNSSGVTVAKNKSHIHFPDLRSSVLPELRGREGKHSKSITKDQRKDKHPVQSSPPSEPQQHRTNSTDSYTLKQT